MAEILTAIAAVITAIAAATQATVALITLMRDKGDPRRSKTSSNPHPGWP